MSEEPWIVWGLDLSYFTGKLEAILRAKGVPYERRNQIARERRRTVAATGIAQMPLVERADGSFLSDTTEIHRWLEDNHSGPSLTPADPKARFVSRLIEDWGDEHLWLPAMAWRWLYAESRTVASGRIVDQMMTDMPGPRWLKKRFIMARQYFIYVYRDGVRTKAHRTAVEDHYRDVLQVLEEIFKKRPYLLGQRPTEADFGLFGPMFRHFFGDVKPGPVMQDEAPNVMLWVAKMWAATAEDIGEAELVGELPDDLGPLLDLIARDYLPYLTANAEAVAAKAKHTIHTMQGLEWKGHAKPFRLWCLSELQREFAVLDDDAKRDVEALLGSEAISHLTRALPAVPTPPPSLPIAPGRTGKIVDSWMR